jgi:hypothetical protein
MMKQVQTFAASLFALAALACSPGGVTTGGGGGGGGGGGFADAGLPNSGRVESGLAALYLFDEGTGTTIYDTSGQIPALDMTIQTPGSVSWNADGLSVNAAASITVGADRITQACQASNAITVEVWAQTADITQTASRIFDFGTGPNDINFSIAQNESDAEARLRTTSTIELEGEVSETSSLVDVLAISGTHLVYSRSGITDEYALWVNGQRTEVGELAGSFSAWLPGASLSIANEPLGNRPWRGDIYLAAVYCRALAPEEIIRNYDEGY